MNRALRSEADRSTTAVKWALANVLAFHTTADRLPIAAEIFRDKTHGGNRAAFVDTFARLKIGEAIGLLNEAMADPELAPYVRRALRRRRSK